MIRTVFFQDLGQPRRFRIARQIRQAAGAQVGIDQQYRPIFYLGIAKGQVKNGERLAFALCGAAYHQRAHAIPGLLLHQAGAQCAISFHRRLHRRIVLRYQKRSLFRARQANAAAIFQADGRNLGGNVMRLLQRLHQGFQVHLAGMRGHGAIALHALLE